MLGSDVASDFEGLVGTKNAFAMHEGLRGGDARYIERAELLKKNSR